ncbi:MAG: DUF1648 domain-containing protein [Thermoleophilia bacterium]
MEPVQRPRVPVERSGVWVSMGALAHAGAVVAVGIVAAAWTSLPARVPLHFAVDGTPDGWGDRWTVWVLPAVAVVMNIGPAVLERYPRIYNYPVRITEANAARQYGLAVGLITLLRTIAAYVGLAVRER